MTRQNFAMSTYLDRFMVIYIEIFTVENRKMWSPYCLSLSGVSRDRVPILYWLAQPLLLAGFVARRSRLISYRPELPLV